MEVKQLQESVRKCQMVSLKAGMEINLTSLRCFCSAFQSTAAADWIDARPSMDLVLGVVNRMWREDRVLYVLGSRCSRRDR